MCCPACGVAWGDCQALSQVLGVLRYFSGLNNLGFGERVATAWARFNGATSSPTIISSYNIASISKTAAGRYSVIFTNAMSSNKYIVIGTAFNDQSDGSALARVFGTRIGTTTGFDIRILDNNSDTYADSNIIDFCVFGGL